MNPVNEISFPLANQPASQPLRHNAASLASDLLPLADFALLLFAVPVSTLLFSYWPMSDWHTPLALSPNLGNNFESIILVAAILAPFILYNKYFGFLAGRGQLALLLSSHCLRYVFFSGIILVLNNIGSLFVELPYPWLATWLLSGLLLTTLTRVFSGQYFRHLQRSGVLAETIAIVGAGPVADRLVHALQQTQSKAIDFFGIFDDKVNNAKAGAIKPVGTVANLIELSKTHKIDWILLTLPPTAEKRVLSIVQRLQTLGVPIGLCPQHVGSTLPYHVTDYVSGNVPVNLLADRPIKRWNAVVKTAEDLILGGIITLLLLPLMAIVAILIKLEDGGPIFFKQRRHSLNNDEFYIYKFRSMRWNPKATTDEKLQQTKRNDERITRLGHFLRSSSIDELPQLFNVLKGDMSLVGPRPHATNMRTEDLLGQEITDSYLHRHRVKPGITGWAQVNGARGATSTTAQLYRRVELDLHYIENWSLLFDIKILFLTCSAVLKKTNAF